MAATFKVLSALLSYPGDDLRAASNEISGILHSEQLINPRLLQALEQLLAEFATLDLFDLQERYVDLFDKTRRLSLHLFEHVHGESRDRGQAMVDLAALYEKGGMILVGNELPDYLPLFLEYLSTRPVAEARALLADTAHIIASLQERLAKRGSAYASVFAVLGALAGGGIATDPGEDEAVDDFVALDAAWEETAVAFGPGDALGGCSVDRLRTQIRAGRRDVRQTAAH
ncbi:nitrate reductase molybdenum cofactor assembly chaperone [Labrys neptuniae]|uniref:nitrate reductase molybdenum cofactor assembly chaperone n=1 Tax=Labrys neptuniae TaxID=376174 RepID=UPI0028902ED9|nr:nitrate reductase molybdenum cofactor assembly chaperone [Labrys neptuniae]MDT3376935.1 nitrate reductase molybdenum cofactor assembly chaperone [Labrys neptuniae]